MDSPFYSARNVRLFCGDCREVLPQLPCYAATIITDPSYGLVVKDQGKWEGEEPTGRDFWKPIRDALLPGGWLLSCGGPRTYHRLAVAVEEAGFEIRDCLLWLFGTGNARAHKIPGYDGWTTRLRPAYNPIIMAMKPRSGTFEANLKEHGVAGLNTGGSGTGAKETYPGNVLVDPEMEEFPEAHRFFECPIASPKERGEGNDHPTVKPLALMRYLCRLTKTPSGGLVLDPFAGSGTTGLAALAEGRPVILVEKEERYCEITARRIEEWITQK